MPTRSRDAGNDQASDSDKSYYSPPVAVTLPKGGGAIKGIGEKFAANPVTGTGSMTVPIATSPGRSGFGPQLSLSYDSGAGNGPFGFGWSLSLPSITRKTDKGLPRYWDREESDVFILSGAEDLVPIYRQDTDGTWVKEHSGYQRDPDEFWVRDANGRLVIHEDKLNGYLVRRYRPRIEGLFARIERWMNQQTGESHWRSISKDNITTLYGKTAESRIADLQEPSHIFSWLICESYDDKGNAIYYRYKSENSEDIDLAQAQESNRNQTSRSANRYLKRIFYGNPTPRQANEDLSLRKDWSFEVVFDYGEHDLNNPKPDDKGNWLCRIDPFSSYRAGFEVRTYRLCQRVLMFHHIPDLPDGTPGCDGLVRSTDLTYQQSEIASFITSVTQSGYKQNGTAYLKKSLPKLEFEYSQVEISEEVQEVGGDSLKNLPIGLDNKIYKWVDLDGEGLSGILTEQAGGWFYKRNLGDLPIATKLNRSMPPEPPIANGKGEGVRFGALELVATKPSLANLQGGQQQLLDLAGDGQLDLVEFGGATPGFYERTADGQWERFKPFESLPNVDWNDPNLRFVDLNGDGHADVLITEQDAFTWYPSLAEAGFGAAERVSQPWDEEQGPRLVFADRTQSVYLADMSGDGLVDLVRITNGEVCYWPSLGYGRFGAKVTMDNAPQLDYRELFDQKRIRVGDIDGSGTTDIFYLDGKQIRIWLNQSGNSLKEIKPIAYFPQVDDLSAVTVVDLLGNGTACLVWSSPLPGVARQPMRYIDLMGGAKYGQDSNQMIKGKPHLLVKIKNNMGAETRVKYASSTKFYLQDQETETPWITKLQFPVHVVERVETDDQITGNRFVTMYRYHHGYFDEKEREFRGFGYVEQWDTETYPEFQKQGSTNALEEGLHVPPVYTRTWFHTGAFLDRENISQHFIQDDYFREPQETEAEYRATLLDDTILPAGLTAEEEREACRSLKGRILRQEVYAVDGTEKSPFPYSVSEQSYAIRQVQPIATNRHGVLFTYDRETINYYYERNPKDPRISHAMTLEVDEFGNVLKSVAIAYPRRKPSTGTDTRQDEQKQTLITYTENQVFNQENQSIDWYRVGVPIETCTYELTGYTSVKERFQKSDFVKPDPKNSNKFVLIFDSEISYEEFLTNGKQRRLIEKVRTLYRKDGEANTTDPTSLPVGQIDSLALPCESFKLAFTTGLLTRVYVDSNRIKADQLTSLLTDEGKYKYTEENGKGLWWIPSGRQAFDPDRFYLPVEVKDPFGHSYFITYDAHKLLAIQTTDPLQNSIQIKNDYRVMQPWEITDPNGNRSRAAFDALGMVVGTAVMGKATESVGDSLDDFNADLTKDEIKTFFDSDNTNPRLLAIAHLGTATTRIIYDLNQVPVCAAAIARETHVSDLEPGQSTKVQLSFVYSDGFGREAQTKVQAEPGEAPLRDAQGHLIWENGRLKLGDTDSRWVGTGRKVYNNKGKPVKQYEPFFSSTHQYETEADLVEWGVTPILHYDPLERVIRTEMPNGTFSKVEFDAWWQESWDANDTVSESRWYKERQGVAAEDAERRAAKLTVAAQRRNLAGTDVGTPSVAHLDVLGRPFLTIADNGIDAQGNRQLYNTHVELDIEGNQLIITDARKNPVMIYAVPERDDQGKLVKDAQGKPNLKGRAFDLLGHNIYSYSGDAGERWGLSNVAGKPMRHWDSRGQEMRYEYDALQRPTHLFVKPENQPEILAERTVYGEGHPQAAERNLKGKAYQLYDGAGVVTSEVYDFKGNLRRSQRQLRQTYRQTMDWSAIAHLTDIHAIAAAAHPLLARTETSQEVEPEAFWSESDFDALNRPMRLRTPHNDAVPVSEIRPIYNEANLLERLEANLRGSETVTHFVSNIDYNAKGQRVLIQYGDRDEDGKVSVAQTEYHYDPDTFRLIQLKTTRETDSKVLQDLHYTYDPVGNIAAIADNAQQTIYFKGEVVSPNTQYEYDALYRLIRATGREHRGQNANNRPQDRPDLKPLYDFNDSTRMGLEHPHNGQAMRNYTEQYDYDPVGNILKMKHEFQEGGWTRYYDYEMDNNRLRTTNIPKDPANPHPLGLLPTRYRYNAHGSMTEMPHLREMQWDFKEQLQQVRLTLVNLETNPNAAGVDRAYYVYDASGQRVRKVIEHSNGNGVTQIKERIYLGGFEIYREYNDGGNTKTLERETLHMMDAQERIALVETKTVDIKTPNAAIKPVIRYQLSNHLGSASVEVDETGGMISYEEYHPYGTTSYQAGRSGAEVSLKRYRYTGKERDEETGLSYHGARYYAPWLGRWISCDPIGIGDGINVFRYVENNPIQLIDLTGQQGTPSAAEKIQETLAAAAGPSPAIDQLQRGGVFISPTQKTNVKESVQQALNQGEQHLRGKYGSTIQDQETKEQAQKQAQEARKRVHEDMARAAPNLSSSGERPQEFRPISTGELEAGQEAVREMEDRERNRCFSCETTQLDAMTVAKAGSPNPTPIGGDIGSAIAGAALLVAVPAGELTGAELDVDKTIKNAQAVGNIANMIAILSGRGVVPQGPSSLTESRAPESREIAWGAPLDSPVKPPPLTMAQGYSYGSDMGAAGYTLALGKFPGNVDYVRATPNSYTADRPWGWTGTYNAGVVRGHLNAGGDVRFTSDTYTGTFELEVRQCFGVGVGPWTW